LIKGPNAQFSVGQKGGASSATPIVTVRPTRLNVAQMPEHSHSVTMSPEDTDAVCYDQHLEEEITTSHSNNFLSRILVYMCENLCISENITKRNVQSDKSTVVATRNSNKVVSCLHRYTIEKQGKSEPHSHEATANSLNITPPFHALLYIMKL